MNKEFWFCVDQDGEKLFKGQKPVRWANTAVIPQDIELWVATGEEGIDYEMMILPKGMIKQTLGTHLTWKSEPILYNPDSVFVRAAERMKVYDQIKDGFKRSWEDQEAFLKNLMDESVMKPSRLLEIISSYMQHQEDLLEKGGFIKEERISYLIEYGKPYACLDKEGKLCKVISGSDKWDDVVYVLPKI